VNLTDLKVAILTATTRAYHYTAPTAPVFPYCVWAEDMQSDALHGDGVMVARVIEGTIDVFSKAEFDPLPDKIQRALNTAGICFRLNSIQYEPDTKIIHHEIVWDIEMEV